MALFGKKKKTEEPKVQVQEEKTDVVHINVAEGHESAEAEHTPEFDVIQTFSACELDLHNCLVLINNNIILLNKAQEKTNELLEELLKKV